MQALSRSIFIVLLGVFSMFASARTSSAQESKKENRASITGRVTLEGKPVPRVTVILTSSDRYANFNQAAPPVKSTTDEDGRYRLTGLSAGSYAVSPNVPAFVVAEERVGQLGQTVNVLEGEEAEDINFTLKQGGVITGRITDADGKPIIGGRVNLMQVDEQGRTFERSYGNAYRFTTDDRGVYRVYGLQPGRYKVSSGDSPDGRSMRPAFAGGGYPRTFHPDVADAAKSPIVEVTAGIEATGIDITVGRVSRRYAATGRVIDAATGAPVANIQFGYGTLPDQKHIMQVGGGSGSRTNVNGEFRIDSLQSGRFAVFLLGEEESEFYSEPAVFDVADSDVSGVEIKLQRGSTISGVAVIEGTEDPDLLAKLSKLEIRAWVQSESLSQPSFAPTKFGVNGGSFRLVGLQPGKVFVSLSNYPPIKGLSLLRVEREGVEQPQGIEVGPGEQVSGVRLVFAYGTGIIRGQVRFQGGERPPNLRMYATVHRVGSVITAAGAEVDARGRFKLEDLPLGEYQVMLLAIPSAPGDRGPTAQPQKVTVVSGSEAEVTFVVNLKPAGKDGEK